MFKKGDKVRCIDSEYRKLTEGDIYEVIKSEYTAGGGDTFIQVKNDSRTVEEFWASRFELVEEEKKMYKEEDIYAGMKLECVSNGGYAHWTEGKVYEVDDNLQIYSGTSSTRSTSTILQYLNENGPVIFKVFEKKVYTEDDLKEGMVLRCTDDRGYDFWTTGKEYPVYKDEKGLYILNDCGYDTRGRNLLNNLNDKGSNARMEIVSTPEPVESEEIILTIKGKTFYDIRSEAEELLNLVNSIIEASEELGISEEKVKRIYGGAK